MKSITTSILAARHGARCGGFFRNTAGPVEQSAERRGTP